MITSAELRAFADQLTHTGWERHTATQLLGVIERLATQYQHSGWSELLGRCRELHSVISAFLRDTPSPTRWSAVLRTVTTLALVLERGPLAERIDPLLLPATPSDWCFLLVGDEPLHADLLTTLTALGFTVARAADIAAVAAQLPLGPTIVLAEADWLARHAAQLQPLLATAAPLPPRTPILVALLAPTAVASALTPDQRQGVPIGNRDFTAQLQARQAGARLLLDTPVIPEQLLSELAGIAWVPRQPYRILLVDADAPRRAAHTALLHAAAATVCSCPDALTAWSQVIEFAPETVIVTLTPSDTSATDFIALLRRDKRFTRLPALYLSTTAAAPSQLTAHTAGSADCFPLPLDPAVFTTTALARARQFRLFEVVYFQRRRAWRELADLKRALDRHSIVSITDPDGTIIDVNEQFCERSGYSREELLGRNHRLLKSALHAPRLYAALWDTISAGRIWQGELQNRHRDGSHYWMQCTVAPIVDEQQRLERYVAIRTEISEQKSLLAQRKRQSRLLDLQRQALQRFISSYDVAATSTLLLEGLLTLTDSRHGILLELQEDSSGGLLLMPQAVSGITWSTHTRQLLDSARAGGMTVRNMHGLLGQIVQHRQTVIINDQAEQALGISVALPPGHPPLHTFLGIPICDDQVLLGILGLANRPGGYDISEITCLHTLTTTYASILAAARLRTVQQQVQETSVQPPADPAPTKTLPPTPRRGHILIAEDNPTNQVLLRMQVEALGHQATLAATGSAALVKWHTDHYDLLLSDLHMPDMDGLALARSIRAAEREHGGHLPIVVITADPELATRSACQAAGIDAVLPKPLDLDVLRQQLDYWLAPPTADRHPTPAVPLTATQPDAILDIAYIVRTVGNISPQQMRELVDLFTMTARADLPDEHHLRRESDVRLLQQVMHRLKSAARMVGALYCAGITERIENALQQDQLEALPRLLIELEHAISDVESAAQRLSHLPPRVNETAELYPPLPPLIIPHRVLVLDDDAIARRQTRLLLTELGVTDIVTVDSGESALAEIASMTNDGIDLLITDLQMPGMDGVQFLRQLAHTAYQGDLIIASGVDEQLLHMAADLMRAKGLHLRGALTKPLTREALAHLLRQAQPQTPRPAPVVTSDITPQSIQAGIQRNEFFMYFQPKVDANTLRCVGVEALARWQQHGQFVRPDLFINAAERYGLIAPLSQVLLQQTVRNGAQLLAAGFDVTIAFNLSAKWLADITLPELIVEHIQTAGFAADNLVLEITETSLLSDLETAMDVLTRLRLKGFKLSIDDFGTGYSSMEQLQRIPFGELKLDRSFVNGAAERPALRAILAASIDMAHKLKLTTVAEGVETQADLDLVRGLGCNLIQGFFIARPLAINDLMTWLRTGPN